MQNGASFKYHDTAEKAVHMGLMDAEAIVGAIPDFDKPAGQPCPHQRHGKGCKVYSKRPMGCRLWSCRWVVEDDTTNMSRPDRCHYVIDMSPDFVTTDNVDGKSETIPVIQVWVDVGYRDAYKDLALREYLIRRSQEGYCALIRFDNKHDCIFLAYYQGKWYEKTSGMIEHEHSALEKAKVLGMPKIILG
jgi:Fe-S-cluster containining protein